MIGILILLLNLFIILKVSSQATLFTLFILLINPLLEYIIPSGIIIYKKYNNIIKIAIIIKKFLKI